FGAVVSSLVADLLTPLIAAIVGEPDFSALTFTINGSEFRYGSFINALISFLSIAAAVFFFVVKPLNAISSRTGIGKREPETRACPECQSDIPVTAHRCAFCAQPVAPAT